MPTGISRELVQQYFQACLARDPAQLAQFLHEDVQWCVTGPIDLLPFCGQRRGKSAVVDNIVRLAPSALRMIGLDLEEMLIDGECAATLSRINSIHAGTGRTVSYRCAQFLRFRDGKLIEFHALIDSFDAAEQVLGHPIDVVPSNAARARNLFAI